MSIAFIALAGLGMMNAITLALNNILIQTHVEEEYRGRMLSLYFVTFSLMPLGVLVSGLVAETIGLQNLFIILGAIIIVSTIWVATKSRHIAHL